MSLQEPWRIEPMSWQIAPGTLKERSGDAGWGHLVFATAVQDEPSVCNRTSSPAPCSPCLKRDTVFSLEAASGKWHSRLKALHFLHRGKCLHCLSTHVFVCVLCWQDSIASDLPVSHNSLMGRRTFSSAWSLYPPVLTLREN